MNRIRAFIAIEFPTTLQKRLATFSQTLRSAGLHDVKWVTAENIHLTLKFLGEIPSETLQSIAGRLPALVAGFSPFTIQVRGLGFFPGPKRPRVIWVGVQAPASLFQLQTEIETLAQQFGIRREERPFSPHITLGRVRPELDLQEQKILANLVERPPEDDFGQLEVEQVCLFRSDLRPEGAHYTVLVHAPLKGS